jgi:hypothetical protein
MRWKPREIKEADHKVYKQNFDLRKVRSSNPLARKVRVNEESSKTPVHELNLKGASSSCQAAC